jgi:prepilin-type N-terminal cleavage/methylation domain-containing protein
MNLHEGGSLKMKKSPGFTLIELMIVIAILGILSASSVRLYGTYRQRATGTEARIMVKQILDAEIVYYLEHETFFPDVGGGGLIIESTIPPDQTSSENIDAISDAINIEITVGHNLSYQLVNYGESFQVTAIADFPMYEGVFTKLIGDVKNTGETIIFPAQ